MSDSERRHFTRVPFDGEARLVDPAGNHQWPTEVIDISLRGVLIHRPQGIEDFSSPCVLQLYLGDKVQLEFNVRIIHYDSEQLGLRIEQLDIDSAAHLHRLLELNLGDPALLERELAELLEPDN